MRTRRPSKISTPRLIRRYFGEGRSIAEISRLHHVSTSALYKRMTRYGLKLRSRGEVKALMKRKNLMVERAKLRKVILDWSLDPDDVLLTDVEVDGLMDRHSAIARELQTLEVSA